MKERDGTSEGWRRVREQWIGSLIVALMLTAVVLALNPTPRNPDNSMKAEIITPAFAAVAALVTLLLWIGPKYRPLRIACWWMAALSYPIAIGGGFVLIVKAVS